jgi:hypothetical protein
MSVATHLDLADPTSGLLGQAVQRWPLWHREYEELQVVDELLDLPAWIRAAERPPVDDVLHRLARLGSPESGDDRVAAGALAWLLLPGAVLVAQRLRHLSPRIDELVAAQLWLEVRGFDWQRRRKVAANIVMNTRRGVLRDLGVGDYDPTWARVVPLAPDAEQWQALASEPAPSVPDAPAELAGLFEWAKRHTLIDDRDARLLIDLAVVAAEVGVRRSRDGRSGLCARSVTPTVAAKYGVSEATVRRRARQNLETLAAAWPQRRSA